MHMDGHLFFLVQTLTSKHVSPNIVNNIYIFIFVYSCVDLRVMSCIPRFQDNENLHNCVWARHTVRNTYSYLPVLYTKCFLTAVDSNEQESSHSRIWPQKSQTEFNPRLKGWILTDWAFLSFLYVWWAVHWKLHISPVYFEIQSSEFIKFQLHLAQNLVLPCIT